MHLQIDLFLELSMVKCELTQVNVREKKAFITLACLKVYFMFSFEAKKGTCTKRGWGYSRNIPGSRIF